MPSPSWEDLGEFLDPDEFGVQCLVTFKAGGMRRFFVIFDDPNVTARAGEYERDDRLPIAGGRECDMVGIHRGDSCAITFERANSTRYTQTFDVMKDPEPRGDGWSELVLSLRVQSET